jgi:hypothetical protein
VTIGKKLYPLGAHEIHTGDQPEPPHARSFDRWLGWAAILGPILGYILGICTGAVAYGWAYRDHEHRIAKLEAKAEIYDAMVTTLKVKGIVK